MSIFLKVGEQARNLRMSQMIEPFGFLLKKLLSFSSRLWICTPIAKSFDNAGLGAIVEIFGEIGGAKAAFA